MPEAPGAAWWKNGHTQAPASGCCHWGGGGGAGLPPSPQRILSPHSQPPPPLVWQEVRDRLLQGSKAFGPQRQGGAGPQCRIGVSPGALCPGVPRTRGVPCPARRIATLPRTLLLWDEDLAARCNPWLGRRPSWARRGAAVPPVAHTAAAADAPPHAFAPDARGRPMLHAERAPGASGPSRRVSALRDCERHARGWRPWWPPSVRQERRGGEGSNP